MLTELTIKEFIHKVISNDPVPGGGSVSAFNGALATSLAAMVARALIDKLKPWCIEFLELFSAVIFPVYHSWPDRCWCL